MRAAIALRYRCETLQYWADPPWQRTFVVNSLEEALAAYGIPWGQPNKELQISKQQVSPTM